MGQVTLELAQPAALGTGVRKAGVQQTHQYIPGTVLRGALAARWIARYGPPTIDNARRAEFERLFEGTVLFGPLFPPCALPMPVSCWVHKYDTGPDCAWWIDEATGAAAPPARTCPRCDQPLKRASGEVTTVRPSGLGRAVHTVEDTHVAIDDKGRARDGELFTRRRLGRGQPFCGYLTGPVPDVDLVASLGTTLWVGGRRSSSGRGRLHYEPATAPPPVEMLDSGTVVVRLGSPGIFVDEFGRPQRDPSDEELSAVLGTSATVIRRWIRWTVVTGWHVASGMPKPAEIAVGPGSTYWLHCADTPSPEALAQLAAEGLGLRRIEGYRALIAGPDVVLGNRSVSE